MSFFFLKVAIALVLNCSDLTPVEIYLILS